MKLIIDVGNTYVKFAIFNDDDIVDKITCETNRFIFGVRKTLSNHSNVNKAIISSVGKLPKSKIATLQSLVDLVIVNSDLNFPFTNKYSTPKTLGADRLALVCAAIKKYPNTNTLVIDAGTCVTYDFVTSNKNYLGGAISPGIRLRYKALNNLTANLPLLDTSKPESIIGDSTENSIHSGVVCGIIKEIDGVVKEYSKKYKDLTVILTGGDTEFLSNQLKSSIFANSNFLLEGLNYILQYNSN